MKDCVSVIIVFAMVSVCFIGYFVNIYKLVSCDFEAPYKCEALHAAGLVPVVGVFTGYMDFGK